MGALNGPNTITGNQAGGAYLQENSEISFWAGTALNIIQGNGPVGVAVGVGSQATFFNSAQISGHSSAGVDLYANAQGYFFGTNSVQGNGASGDARSAGVRVDGNSQALLRGGQISGNTGPGVLLLVNSSADFSGVNFQWQQRRHFLRLELDDGQRSGRAEQHAAGGSVVQDGAWSGWPASHQDPASSAGLERPEGATRPVPEAGCEALGIHPMGRRRARVSRAPRGLILSSVPGAAQRSSLKTSLPGAPCWRRTIEGREGNSKLQK